MVEKLTIRPYARLITMLGDQLIKNELIAIVELIKNSYDADANWVKVSFIDFGDNFSKASSSKIIIEDDGCGMDETTIKQHWLNPATPDKLKRARKTEKGRILQGEKGIGRFAIFKLGKKIKIITRRKAKNLGESLTNEGEPEEYTLLYDFSKYDDNFLTEGLKEKELFLEDLTVELSKNVPNRIVSNDVTLGGITHQVRNPYGTIIEISDLKSDWTSAKVERIQKDVGKLQPIFAENESADFNVWIYKNKILSLTQESYKKDLNNYLNGKAVFRVTDGKYLEGNEYDNSSITFKLNDKECTLSFDDPDIKGIKQFTKHFEKPSRKTECGSFDFEFYIFDFNADSKNRSKYYLDRNEKEIIKEHRIYLYRDGIRVMPYGDPDDDWLRIDMIRGTVGAREFLSNDQIVGCVYISQKTNPKLKDKTNREGLIEDGQALADFTNVLQVILRYLRKKPFAQYLVDKAAKIEIDRLKQGRPLELIESTQKQYANDEKMLAFLQKFKVSYTREIDVLDERIVKTENLAAVGLSVEMASHDVMLLMKNMFEQLDVIIKDLASGQKHDGNELLLRLRAIRGSLSMVESQMKDIQLLFPSTKSRTKNINIKEIINKVYRLYQRPFTDGEITVAFKETRQPLIARTTDAVLLQVFINLFDNALYWLKTVDYKREIIIFINGNEQRLIFSDNGPGIKPDDENYIFEAFYSGKGEEGRGLGLYIAKQLLDRYDYSITLAEFSKDRILAGANFVLEFVREG
jgi:signal transduction histidine kinase